MDSQRRECGVSVILLAGGSGRRFGTTVPKLLASVKSKPLIAYPIEIALSLEFVDELVVVCHPGIRRRTDEIVSDIKRAPAGSVDKVLICDGGDSRAASVEAGLMHASGRCVMIHDGDRPLATAGLYRRVLDALRPGTGVVPAMRPADSVIQEDQAGPSIGYLPRHKMLLAQTPQAFFTEEYRAARKGVQSRGEQHTDDGSVFAANGGSLVTVPGEQSNVKVTFPVDIRVVEFYLDAMKDE
ncbi:2-C-methyl-D-erythritol 4-phosphate cytidylyltransferase [bacterium]|nr:2-C-methyl-D-erythritol 4-phosphate cytidylyltransferase [bacterium]